MDITILLWFQKIRIMLGPAAETAVSFLSDLAGAGSISLLLYLFWAKDRKNGRYFLLVMIISVFLNQFLKVTFTVFRPWILWPDINPAEAALKHATGYSFPSGHTQCACAACFSILMKTDRQEYRRERIFMVFTAVFTGFSRMYLGVHTPQDVLAGAAVSAFSAYAGLLIESLMNDPAKRRYCIAAGMILAAASAYYTLTKIYPGNYVNGAISLNPSGMITDSLMHIGASAGGFCFLCSREDSIPAADKEYRLILKAAVSIILLAALSTLIITVINIPLNYYAALLAGTFAGGAAAVTLVPEYVFDRPLS